MIELTDKPIDVARVLASVTDPTCGAEVLFVGTTRQWTQVSATTVDQQVRLETQASETQASETQAIETSHLVYECYPELAMAELKRLADEARQRWPVQRLAIVHRLGRVEPLEASVAVAVSCPHRGEAFEAGKWLIDQLKHTVPIWKQEHYVQSGAEWIHPTTGNCSCPK